MGLFNWLAGKKDLVEIVEDRVWLTAQAKYDGIGKEIAAWLAEPDGPCAIFAVAHFKDCLEELRPRMTQFAPNDVLPTLAGALGGRTPTNFEDVQSRSIGIVVAERHPLRSHNQVVLDFARGLNRPCRVAWHVSLEDAVLKRFCGEWIQGVLRRLGAKEDQAIEGRMTGRRIQSALDKLERSATGDAPADSVDEWLARNCPETSFE